MSALDAARDRFIADHRAFAESRRGEPAWLAAHRRDAIAAFAARGLPSTRSVKEARLEPVTRRTGPRSETRAVR